nr:diguanylate cyclase [Marinobacter similis]
MSKPASATRTLVRVLLSPVFPVLIFLVFLALATLLRHGLEQQDNRQIAANLEHQAEAMAAGLEREFSIHVKTIQRMAERLEVMPETPESVWSADARRYLKDFGVYQAVEWIDRNFIIRWLEPVSGNPDVIGFNVAFSEQRRQALESARATGNPDISGVISLKQGGQGFVIYAPVGTGTDNNGFIAGVFRMEVLAQQMLSSRILDSFQIDLITGDTRTYQLTPSDGISEIFAHTEPVNLPTLNWSFTLHPTEAWVQNQRSDWPAMTFGSLSLLGLLTSLTTLLVQLILKRNRALLKTRIELDREIDQRKIIQQDVARLESTDTLTGLANRRFFMEDLAHTLSIADRQMRQVALVLLDLDRFQMLNDSLGHQFGDELLIKISERLNGLGDERILVAYAGGDEFMLCQQQVDSVDDVIHLLGEVKQCFEAPYEVQGQAST